MVTSESHFIRVIVVFDCDWTISRPTVSKVYFGINKHVELSALGGVVNIV